VDFSSARRFSVAPRRFARALTWFELGHWRPDLSASVLFLCPVPLRACPYSPAMALSTQLVCPARRSCLLLLHAVKDWFRFSISVPTQSSARLSSLISCLATALIFVCHSLFFRLSQSAPVFVFCCRSRLLVLASSVNISCASFLVRNSCSRFFDFPFVVFSVPAHKCAVRFSMSLRFLHRIFRLAPGASPAGFVFFMLRK
jgi:hypothetical protein